MREGEWWEGEEGATERERERGGAEEGCSRSRTSVLCLALRKPEGWKQATRTGKVRCGRKREGVLGSERSDL